jgi:hypothetical protein
VCAAICDAPQGPRTGRFSGLPARAPSRGACALDRVQPGIVLTLLAGKPGKVAVQRIEPCVHRGKTCVHRREPRIHFCAQFPERPAQLVAGFPKLGSQPFIRLPKLGSQPFVRLPKLGPETIARFPQVDTQFCAQIGDLPAVVKQPHHDDDEHCAQLQEVVHRCSSSSPHYNANARVSAHVQSLPLLRGSEEQIGRDAASQPAEASEPAVLRNNLPAPVARKQ